MKKLLLVLLLSISSVVHAQWTNYATSTDDNKFYIDKKSIQQTNQYKRAWTKVEFHASSNFAKKYEVLSARALREIDCREKKYRTLSTHYFKQSNLIEIKDSDDIVTNWQFIAPESVDEKMYEFVCKSK